MKILTFTTLYPNSVQPWHGTFVEQRLREIVEHRDAQAVVVAPVPWFPSTSRRFGRYAEFARVPPREVRHGVEIHHPPYPVVPKVGMMAAPDLMVAALRPFLRCLWSERGGFDLIDAHFLYPDGVCAVTLARELGVPVVVTGRGTDVHTYLNSWYPRRRIQRSLDRAERVVCVAETLRRKLLGLGVDSEKLVTLRNGVDTERFHPGGREEARRRLGFNGTVLLSVGSLRDIKGHDLTLRALSRLPDCRLVVVGNGERGNALVRLAGTLQLEHRVSFVPAMSQAELRDYYVAADILVLASSREGWPNVLLEAMACGTPVVATDCGAVREIVGGPVAGRVVAERDPQILAAAIVELGANAPRRADTRSYAERFDWKETAQSLYELFAEVIDGPSRAAA